MATSKRNKAKTDCIYKPKVNNLTLDKTEGSKYTKISTKYTDAANYFYMNGETKDKSIQNYLASFFVADEHLLTTEREFFELIQCKFNVCIKSYFDSNVICVVF